MVIKSKQRNILTKQILEDLESPVGYSNNFVLSLVALVMLGVGLAAGYFIWSSSATPNILTNVNDNPIPSEQPIVKPDQTNNSTDDWKSYTSSEIGYTIKYPDYWHSYQYPEISPQIPTRCALFGDVVNPQDIPSRVRPEGHSLVQVCFTIGEMPKTVISTNGSTINPSVRDVQVNGYSGIRGSSTSSLGAGEVVHLSNGGKSFVTVEYLLGDKKIFEQMLSTLQFKQ